MLVLAIFQFVLWIATTWFLIHIIMKLVKKHEEFEDELMIRIDSSLQALDMCHNQIAVVAATPVFFDSQEVRQVVNAVKMARTAVSDVATIFRDIELEKNIEADELMPDLKYLAQHSEEEIEQTDAEKKRDIKKMMDKVRKGEAEILRPQNNFNVTPDIPSRDPHAKRNKIVADRINRSRGNS